MMIYILCDNVGYSSTNREAKHPFETFQSYCRLKTPTFIQMVGGRGDIPPNYFSSLETYLESNGNYLGLAIL